VKVDENVSLYLLKEKLHYIERDEREDLAPSKIAKRPRSETQSSTAIMSSSKAAKGLDVSSKKVKLEQEDEAESEQEGKIKEESETSDLEDSDDDSENGDDPFASPDPPIKQEVKEEANNTSSDDEQEIQGLGEESSDEEKVAQHTIGKRAKDWSYLGPAVGTRRRHSQE
jgi:hypothetical protein